MKRLGCIIPLALIVILLLVFALGPRVDIEPNIEPVSLPADLDDYLATSEAQFGDIIEGTEKTILWADPTTKAKTDIVLVYIHGFSATRQETAPLSDLVAADLGANLYYERLTGHGRSGAAMAEASVNAWANDVAEAVEIGRALGDQVVLVGVSTGGSLALWYAASEYAGDDIAAVVLVSPNMGPADPASELLLLPWGEQLVRMIIGPERSWEGDNAEHERFWTNRYPTEALLPMMGAVELARNADLTALNMPVMTIYSPLDPVVDPQKTEAMFAALPGPGHVLMPIENPEGSSNHVLAGDILSPGTTEMLAEEIATFIRDVSP